ncbi:RNA polymerase sigma factor [Singulisphaera acidiphila]|uniref:RNA polymerase sigma factor, sigma-70 family n=1 Tax=Singulisphaera acidiphila (strain ATCC BAA-1392 / DSM 18658 / VKM B-2454 / MOB10) TaxID=886293 RepID=L0DA12_SINAD|nr:RNA polymerase sigma factor [Singulisphaera acidiphila]AGA25705.1 RNA polymerase sigma factor, sigma-70 family [Singulisphaera acidiphila DSM 18658]
MASRRLGVTIRRIERLFHLGTVAGMSEVQLLERFVLQRDEAAFEALVARHGPMVMGVCRQWLRDPSDAEDAFQATFLVLVRKAGSLRDCALLGNWLYGVAYRVSLRARAESAKRRSRETARIDDRVDPQEPGSQERYPWLYEEVNRLPEKYRAPIVLCYLEGRTHEEAAEQLCWPVGTVKGRLARARALLRSRLSRRGLAPSVGVLTAALSGDALAAVPVSLIESTVLAASGLVAAKGVAAGLIPAQVALLMEGVSHSMFLSKLKLVAASVVIAGLVTTSAGVIARQAPGARSEHEEGERSAVGSNGPLKSAGPRETVTLPNRLLGEAISGQGSPKTDQEHIGLDGKPIDRNEEEIPLDPQRDDPRIRAALARQALDWIAARQTNGQEVTPESEYERLLRLSEWSLRLFEAERQASATKSDRVAAAEAHLARMKKALDLSVQLQQSGMLTNLDSFETAFRYREAVKGVIDAKTDQTPVVGGTISGNETLPGSTGHMQTPVRPGPGPLVSTDSQANYNQTSLPGPTTRASGPGVIRFIPISTPWSLPGETTRATTIGEAQQQGGGGFHVATIDGGGVGRYDDADHERRATIAQKARRVAVNDTSPQTKGILKKLDDPISMSFGKETSLSDILKYIKSATTGANDTGIPIYVDLVGLQEAKKTMSSPVTLDLEGVPLKTTLRLILKQVGLAYCVKDGLLLISSPRGIVQELEEAESILDDESPQPR